MVNVTLLITALVNLSWFDDNIAEAERKAMWDCVAWPVRTL
jgi:hypothetical protein